MAKYSALILFVTLAVFWSSAEASYNKYQDEVINVMTKYFIEELRDLSEPQKSRLINKLTEAKDREWDDITDYFGYVKRLVASELYRYKRSDQPASGTNSLRKIDNMLGEKIMSDYETY